MNNTKEQREGIKYSEHYEFVNTNLKNVEMIEFPSNIPIKMLTGEHPGYVLGLCRYGNTEYCAILDVNTFTVHINKVISRNGNSINETDAILEPEIEALITAKFDDENVIHSMTIVKRIVEYIGESATTRAEVEYAAIREAIELAKSGLINIADLKAIVFSKEQPEQRYSNLLNLIANRRSVI